VQTLVVISEMVSTIWNIGHRCGFSATDQLDHSAHALFAQRTRIPTSARCIGFCVIWVCISSSSSSDQLADKGGITSEKPFFLAIVYAYLNGIPLLNLGSRNDQNRSKFLVQHSCICCVRGAPELKNAYPTDKISWIYGTGPHHAWRMGFVYTF